MNLKKVRCFFLSACLMLFVSSTSLSYANTPESLIENQSNNKYKTHVVEKGETVYSISKRYNVSIDQIYRLNPSLEHGLKVGSVINISQDNSSIPVSKKDTSKEYTVQAKETLYSICKNLGVSIDDMADANPELKEKPLYVGQRLIIPNTQAKNNAVNNAKVKQHTVLAKETLFGISRSYNTTPDELVKLNPSLQNGLKEGMIILIPDSNSNTINTNTTVNSTSALQNTSAVNIGIVLPFLNKSDAQKARFLEYYEGFLLALQQMKNNGLSANVYVFDIGSDTGTAKLNSLLDTYEMKNLDMIIGGVSADQIAIMSNFAKQNKIKYVIPFPSKSSNLNNNSQIFQVNTPSTQIYENVVEIFNNTFGNSNIIFIKGENDDKKDFISILSKDLSKHNISSQTILNNPSLKNSITSAINPNKRNIIIPMSGSSQALQDIITALNSIQESNITFNVSLFGYPEWQTYHQFDNSLSKYNSYLFSPFYANEKDLKVSNFNKDYKYWYNNKPTINTYPRYSMLGYDTGLFFLSAFKQYGKNFESSIDNIKIPTLQTSFAFNRISQNGGYMNNGVYIINYKPNGSIEKTEYRR